jgi:hypothetical protein
VRTAAAGANAEGQRTNDQECETDKRATHGRLHAHGLPALPFASMAGPVNTHYVHSRWAWSEVDRPMHNGEHRE